MAKAQWTIRSDFRKRRILSPFGVALVFEGPRLVFVGSCLQSLPGQWHNVFRLRNIGADGPTLAANAGFGGLWEGSGELAKEFFLADQPKLLRFCKSPVIPRSTSSWLPEML